MCIVRPLNCSLFHIYPGEKPLTSVIRRVVTVVSLGNSAILSETIQIENRVRKERNAKNSQSGTSQCRLFANLPDLLRVIMVSSY